LIIASDHNLSNYPNPFNPSTNISFLLTTENAEDVTLVIYNLKGQKVKDLSPDLCNTESINLEGEKLYTITWNGTDTNSNPVASGIYYYRLSVNRDVNVINKMLLLK